MQSISLEALQKHVNSSSIDSSLRSTGLIGVDVWNWSMSKKIVGLVIKIFCMGITLDGQVAAISTGALVMSSILVGIGGLMSVVGSRVAS